MKKDTKNILNNYFVALYTLNDEIITTFEDIEMLSHAINMRKGDLLRAIREKNNINIFGHRAKIYLYEKQDIKERGKSI